MSKIKCNKCGADIKINTIFLEKAGCENCGNRIDFTAMDQLSGLRHALILVTAVVCGIALLIFMLSMGISFDELGAIWASMSAGSAGMLLLAACVIVLIVGTLERVIGCSIYEQWRQREEELEKIAEEKRRQDALQAMMDCDNE